MQRGGDDPRFPTDRERLTVGGLDDRNDRGITGKTPNGIGGHRRTPFDTWRVFGIDTTIDPKRFRGNVYGHLEAIGGASGLRARRWYREKMFRESRECISTARVS